MLKIPPSQLLKCVLGYLREDPRRTIVSTLEVGDFLGTLMSTSPPSLDVLCDVYYQALIGLAELHAAGIGHLDVKPNNVLVKKDVPLPVAHALSLLQPSGRVFVVPYRFC